MMAPAGFEPLDGLRGRRRLHAGIAAEQEHLEDRPESHRELRALFGRGRSAGGCAGATCPAALLRP